MNRRMPTNVLFFDCRDAKRGVLADALRSAALDVTTVSEPKDALQLLKEHSYQVVLVCLDATSRHERVQFCRTVKVDRLVANFPVLLLQAFEATGDDLQLAMDLGVLLLKVSDWDGSKLVAAVEGVLAARRSEASPAGLNHQRALRRAS